MTRISVHSVLRLRGVPADELHSRSARRRERAPTRRRASTSRSARRSTSAGFAVDPLRHDLVRVIVDPGTAHRDLRRDGRRFGPTSPTTSHVPRSPFADLPGDVLGYLHPSRYCQSDLLSRLAAQTFGHLEPGFERVTGICNWIWELLSYVPGSTDATTTAVDVLVSAAGVLSRLCPPGHQLLSRPRHSRPLRLRLRRRPRPTRLSRILRGLPRRRLVPLRRHAQGTHRRARPHRNRTRRCRRRLRRPRWSRRADQQRDHRD